MKKIISLFQRNHETNRLIRNEITPGAEWVIEGGGTATRKFDGTCCLVRDGKFYKRCEVKKGKSAPDNFEAACEVDPNTGKQQGWVPVGDGNEDKWHREAIGDNGVNLKNGTYELLGPKIQGNPEGVETHILVSHEHSFILEDCPRTFEELKEYLSSGLIEGVVFHHPDGRMAKVKGKDFGIKRQEPSTGPYRV